MKTFKNKRPLLIVPLCITLTAAIALLSGCTNIPNTIETFSGEDGSTWEQVSEPGFGNTNNMSVVAMAEYEDRLYALTRNQAQGCEVWRTNSSGGWEQVLFPGGATNGIYGNPRINNVWARMIVFKDRLYVGFSSGLQGNYLGSSGCEIWRYDGQSWEPVISDKSTPAASGAITAISGCVDNDGDTTALITDSAQSWTDNEWAGAVLTITTGGGAFRKFRIISNTANVLTIQQNETAGTYDSAGEETEFTVCAGKTYNNPFPAYSYSLGLVQTNDSYQIGTDYHQNGFGDFWNKTITAMRLFNNRLYVSTGLNYEYGAQVWYTEDGNTWTESPSVISIPAPFNVHSFGNFHSNSAYPGGYKPVSSSITDLVVSPVSGTPVLYAGGTGPGGNLGGCSRMARLTAKGWELIVDVSLNPENDTATNYNGFGSGSDCSTNQKNFMPWSLADFSDKLLVGVSSGDGARVLYAPSGLADIKNDGSWFYSVGGTSSYPNGFDGAKNAGYPPPQNYQNLATNLFPFDNMLYGGLITLFVPELGATEQYLTGSQIWKSPDGLTWEQVTGNGFGDKDIVNFEAFTVFNKKLYVAGSKGASSTPTGLGGAKVFRLAD